MKPVLVVAVVLAWGVGLGGCSEETVYVVQEDGGAASDTGAAHEDAGDLADAGPSCGEGIYPCPPYGTTSENVIENLTFTGWIDDQPDHQPLNYGYRPWGLELFHQLALAGDAKFLILNVSAGWCSVCKEENRALPALADSVRDQGVVFAEVLFQDAQADPVSADFVENWADSFNLNFTVGADPTFKMGRYFDAAASPANLIIDLRTMVIQSIELGYDPASMEALVAELASLP